MNHPADMFVTRWAGDAEDKQQRNGKTEAVTYVYESGNITDITPFGGYCYPKL